MEKITHWILNKTQPTVYDGEEVTVLKLIGRLIANFNKLMDNIDEVVKESVAKFNYDLSKMFEIEKNVNSTSDKANKNESDLTICKDKLLKQYTDKVNIKSFENLVVNGDWTPAFEKAIELGIDLYMPKGNYTITRTLKISKPDTTWEGETHSGWAGGVNIIWGGETLSKGSMIVLGGNDVGEPITEHCSNVKLINITLDAKQKVGIGVYATYFTNESTIKNVSIYGTTSHGLWLGTSWYGIIENILAYRNMGNGISIGMPLKWNDGTETTFAKSLEVNNCKINNIRSNYAGQDRRYNWTTNRMWGYGIGIGKGNGIRAAGVTSESSDGVGLYCLIDWQHSHTVKDCYFEYNGVLATQGGRSARNYAVVYDINSPNVWGIKLEDCFISANNAEGIAQVGTTQDMTEYKNKIVLSNISYGGFLTEDALNIFETKNCYYKLARGN